MGTPFDNLMNSDLSSVLSSCQPELQEFMRQINIMMEEQMKAWQEEMLALKTRLRNTEEQLRASKDRYRSRGLEVKLLGKQVDEIKAGQQEMVNGYEQLLHDANTELDTLRKSYQRLQNKPSGAQSRETPEVAELKQNIEGYKQLCSKYEIQQKAIDAQNKCLMDKLKQVNLQCQAFQKEGANFEDSSDLQTLQAQLKSAQDHLHLQELELNCLRPLELFYAEKDVKRKYGNTDGELRRLREENNSLVEQLQAREEVIGTLESIREVDVNNLQNELEKTIATVYSAQACERDMKAEAMRLRDKLDQTRLQTVEHSKTKDLLKEAREQNDSLVAEVNKLREELYRAQQTQTQQSRDAERLQMRKSIEEQLGALKTENQHLRDHLHRLEQNLSEEPQQKKARSERHRADQAGEDIRRMMGTRSLEDLQGSEANLTRRMLHLDMAQSLPEEAAGEKLSTSPQGSVVVRFLDQESHHSSEFLEKLDSYILAFRLSDTGRAAESDDRIND